MEMAVDWAFGAGGQGVTFVSRGNEDWYFFRNRGDGTFEEVALEAGVALTEAGQAVSSMGVDFRDYDNDSRPDIVFTALTGETFPVFRNLGGGYFRDVTYPSKVGLLSAPFSGWGVGFSDFNNDGWKDLFTAGSHVTDNIELFSEEKYEQPNRILANRGDGTFEDVSAGAGRDFRVAGAHRGSAVADFNNDGRIDVVVSVLDAPAELWENVSSSVNRWIRFKLEGTRSNRDGIGAEIVLGDQHNRMTTNVGYASSSHFGVHFGVGAARMIPRVEIRWPSGIQQVLEHVKTN